MEAVQSILTMALKAVKHHTNPTSGGHDKHLRWAGPLPPRGLLFMASATHEVFVDVNHLLVKLVVGVT